MSARLEGVKSKIQGALTMQEVRLDPQHSFRSFVFIRAIRTPDVWRRTVGSHHNARRTTRGTGGQGPWQGVQGHGQGDGVDGYDSNDDGERP